MTGDARYRRYLALRRRFAVSRELAAATLAWAEPLARKALGVHARRDQLGLGDSLPYLCYPTTGADNGGWGELMPVWFKPYERPLPIFVLDNWALVALLWEQWLGDLEPVVDAADLARIFLGGDLLIPFLPPVQGGGNFLRHGALPLSLAVLWLERAARDAFLAGCEAGARRFTATHGLADRPDLGPYLAQVEFEAFFLAEGRQIAGAAAVRAFLADPAQFDAYAALFGGLCLSLAALHAAYGPDWESWIFQTMNVAYRLKDFGLAPLARWLATEGR